MTNLFYLILNSFVHIIILDLWFITLSIMSHSHIKAGSRKARSWMKQQILSRSISQAIQFLAGTLDLMSKQLTFEDLPMTRHGSHRAAGGSQQRPQCIPFDHYPSNHLFPFVLFESKRPITFPAPVWSPIYKFTRRRKSPQKIERKINRLL